MLRVKSNAILASRIIPNTNSNIRWFGAKIPLKLQSETVNSNINTSEKILFEDLRTNQRNFDESELKAKATSDSISSPRKAWSTYKLPSKDNIQLQEAAIKEKIRNQENIQAANKLAAISNTETKAPTKLRRTAAAASASSSSSRVANRRRNRQKNLKAPIIVLPNALDHLKKLNSQPTPKFIKIGVTSRGCSGLSYDLQYVTEANKYDEVIEQDGVKIIIDSKALLTIIGSEMDWVDDKLSNRFVFKNPNSKGTCGCGESFHV
ncbi:hypothetical protein QEN19_003889 [Hanseniaspora menglaensis]